MNICQLPYTSIFFNSVCQDLSEIYIKKSKTDLTKWKQMKLGQLHDILGKMEMQINFLEM